MCSVRNFGMAGHLALDVESLRASSENSFIAPLEHIISVDIAKTNRVSSSSTASVSVVEGSEGSGGIRVENEGFLTRAGVEAECRICHEEDYIENLDIPCACRGSVKHAHQKCVQHWCDQKGDTVCEICKQPYKDYCEAKLRAPKTQLITSPPELGDTEVVATAAANGDFLDPYCCGDTIMWFLFLCILIVMPVLLLLLKGFWIRIGNSLS